MFLIREERPRLGSPATASGGLAEISPTGFPATDLLPFCTPHSSRRDRQNARRLTRLGRGCGEGFLGSVRCPSNDGPPQTGRQREDNRMPTQLTGLRLKEEARSRLHTLAAESGRSLADVATAGIDALWESREAAMAERRERVRRTVAFLEELRRRLGDDLLEGAGEVAFSNSGPIAVEAHGISYVLTNDGTIVASRETGGHSEMSVVGESGISEWIAAAPAEPALN